MSAFLALDAARAAGIQVRLDGKDLVVSATNEPPTEVLDMLRRHKLSIIALLQSSRPAPIIPSITDITDVPSGGITSTPSDDIHNITGTPIAGSASDRRDSAADWQAFFDQQVRIGEGFGLARRGAEVRAFDDCVAEWLRLNLVVTGPGPCPVCGDRDRPNDPQRSIGIIGGRDWLHRGCVKAWCRDRKGEAVAALASMGIRRPGGR